MNARRRMWCAGLAVLTVALPAPAALQTSAAAGAASERQPLLVLISGCDGFVARGGTLPNPWAATAPTAYEQTHNFALTSAEERWSRSVVSSPRATVRVSGSGRDDAGNRFRLATSVMHGDADLFGGGTVRITRTGGASLSGTVELANLPVVLSPLYDRRALIVRASRCSLP